MRPKRLFVRMLRQILKPLAGQLCILIIDFYISVEIGGGAVAESLTDAPRADEDGRGGAVWRRPPIWKGTCRDALSPTDRARDDPGPADGTQGESPGERRAVGPTRETTL